MILEMAQSYIILRYRLNCLYDTKKESCKMKHRIFQKIILSLLNFSAII